MAPEQIAHLDDEPAPVAELDEQGPCGVDFGQPDQIVPVNRGVAKRIRELQQQTTQPIRLNERRQGSDEVIVNCRVVPFVRGGTVGFDDELEAFRSATDHSR